MCQWMIAQMVERLLCSRDEIVVEIVALNGESYTGTVTPSEARKTIYGDDPRSGSIRDHFVSATNFFL